MLNRKYDCTIQIGGSDQWGNITAGIDLIRRVEGASAFAITYPLITKSDGTKLGKSTGGSIWLDRRKTSPFSFYQFWLNTTDEEAIRYLNTFTFLAPEEANDIERRHNDAPENRLAQKMLAAEVTKIVHGSSGLEAAERITAALFGSDIASLREDDFEQLALDGISNRLLKSRCSGLGSGSILRFNFLI